MTENMSFNDAIKAYMKTLQAYVPVVDRVHGAHHPEFHEVRALFDKLVQKTKEKGSGHPALSAEFLRLREVTNHYKVPEDVCESYEAVYQMLGALDRAWHA